ncbi:MAG: menaquinone biosynthesis protein [Planctomycetaceae bacterium]|jgi:chorismate dehydratase|nr:menaquinone biosynthesis protein [Planctomycetaceae bacterium]
MTKILDRPLRIASVPYCNTLPLIYYLPEYLPKASLTAALPSALRRQFENDTVDLALMPVAELPFLPQCRIVSNCCIACNGAVRSVLLFSKKPIEQIQTLALDTASRSSVTLCELIFRHFYRKEPVKQPLLPDQNLNECSADAFVVIGDRALAHQASAEWSYGCDLGEWWKDKTGLPMVFAAWIGTEPVCSSENVSEMIAALESARDRGLQNLEPVLDGTIRNGKTPLPQNREAMLDYYRRAVVYTMGDAEREGLRLYFDLAARCGLLPETVYSVTAK